MSDEDAQQPRAYQNEERDPRHGAVRQGVARRVVVEGAGEPQGPGRLSMPER